MLSNNIKITENTIKEQLKKGKNEKDIYKEGYDFLLMLLKSEETKYIQEQNRLISNGIHNLASNDKWTNLSRISKHALTACLDIVKQKETLEKHIEDIIAFKLFILCAGKAEFINFLTDEAKEKFFKK